VPFPPTRIAAGHGATAIAGWAVASSGVVADGGALVSRADYRPSGSWLPAPPRSTVMAAMLANGRYPDVFFSTNMRDQIDTTAFQLPWWYRATFLVSGKGGRTLLRLDGVIHKAQLWVNGTRVADTDEIAGAYPVHTFDVTKLVTGGENAVALRVFPGHPMTDLSIGWVDWNPVPPDANMGVWRDVVVLRTGDVRLADPHVLTELSDTLDSADLRVAVDAENAADTERMVTLVGTVSGHGEARTFSRDVRLAPGERRRVVFTAAETPQLRVADPAVWWPAAHGAQPLYELRLSASVDGVPCDHCATTFGIRSVTSRIAPGGGREFTINGRRIQIMGGGWCPDIFLRYDHQRLVDEMTYTLDMGLNAIRLEGKLENPEFYELADRLGVLVLPGWECCDKWEAHAGTGGAPWSEQDYLIARRSMASEARLLRNHPCVISFQIGSDFAPEAKLADIYVNELKAADWTLPIVSSGASEWNNDWAGGPSEYGTTATAGAGPSGMKMWPYDWVPPVYWYGTQYGAAIGFDSECSAGHSIPRLPSLRKMMTADEIEQLWQHPEARHYHAAPPSPFENLSIFATALAARYGEIASLRDFIRKAQLTNYEMVRAQFEAYGGRFCAPEPATGLIYWMLNTAWPSLNWHLYDYYLDPAGAYFGAKKANEPLHVQLTYDTGEVLVVNRTNHAAGPLAVEATVRDIGGRVRSQRHFDVERIDAGAVVNLSALALPDDVSPTYFVELEMSAAGAPVSRNVYWMSTKADVLDWEKTFWQHTPQEQYADLSGLQDLAMASIEATVESASELGRGTTRVTLRNSSAADVPAVGVHVSVVAGGRLEQVLPILWSDNDVTLFGGQSVTLTATYSAAGIDGVPAVQVDAFNLKDPFIVTAS
jgi:exo-1,4-beta-D-glucosaminidase